MLSKGILEIDKEVPFGDWIHFWLQVTHGTTLGTLIQRSDEYERPYLAWELVRKGKNPYFENGTGFEGYFVGVCNSAGEALQNLLKLGQDMLEHITRLHRYEYQFRSRLLKTLTGELNDPHAMSEWSAELGAELAKLRCNLLRNRQANAFQTDTYRTVRWLPRIDYVENDHTIRQHYRIVYRSAPGARLVVAPGGLKPSEQEAWLVVQSVGKFGHPLVREFIRFDVY